MGDLIRYDAMCHAIDQAFKVDEVKDIRDKALALEAYSRQARNTEAERRACEIRLRAERKAGKLLAQMPKAKGAQMNGRSKGGTYRRSHDATTEEKTLDDIGISKTQSSKWQGLAEVPEEQFEAALAAPEKPTTAGILREAQEPKRKPIDAKELWLWGRLRDFAFPNLQARYPSADLSPSGEPEYVRLELLTDEDVAFNVDRLRKEASSKLRHADALEAWAANRKRNAA